MADSNLPVNPNFKADNALISSGTRWEKFRHEEKARKIIRNVKTLKLDEMKKHGDDLYEIHLVNEKALIDAFNDKRLKSKRLIKKAKKVIKRREEEATNKKKATE